MSRRLAVVVLASVPMLLGASASDPRGDVVACRGGHPLEGRSIDLVGAEARAIEGGSAIRFTVSFARRLRAPDREGRPLRVDVVLRDPDVPSVSFAYYRDVNRIVRFDAVIDPELTILLLPERGSNTSLGVRVEGRRLIMELPGRVLVRDVDLEGPPLERLTWSVIARDEQACDLLGNGRPTLAVTPSDPIRAPSEAAGDGGVPRWAIVAAAIGLVAAAAGYVVLVHRRETPR